MPAAPTFTVTASRIIGASASEVYRLIADYQGGHQRILPAKYFGKLRATKGGYGDGTEIAFEMYPFGMKGSAQQARSRVTEPEPGHVLVETDLDRGFVTTFTVDAVSPTSSRVEFVTAVPRKPGIFGALERALISGFLRRVYDAELKQLDDVAGADANAKDAAGRNEAGARR
jgi:polyketide cyclase/dehydrase/lipid transport protein